MGVVACTIPAAHIASSYVASLFAKNISKKLKEQQKKAYTWYKMVDDALEHKFSSKPTVPLSYGQKLFHWPRQLVDERTRRGYHTYKMKVITSEWLDHLQEKEPDKDQSTQVRIPNPNGTGWSIQHLRISNLPNRIFPSRLQKDDYSETTDVIPAFNC